MPQITVNEIDQSVVTRVVSDNRVKILIPAITSFGPLTPVTADDLSDFNRKLGYTPAEFNPFDDDKSRIYARELMKRGSAVSVVRVNTDGETSDFDIKATKATDPDTEKEYYDTSVEDRTNPTMADIPESVYPSIVPKTYTVDDAPTNILTMTVTPGTYSTGKIPVVPSNADWTNSRNWCQAIPGTISVTAGTKVCYDSGKIRINNDKHYLDMYYTDETTGVKSKVAELCLDGSGTCGRFEFTADTSTEQSPFIGEATSVTVATKILPDGELYKYVFAPQIKAITAKYPGSFGNNLYISISQITTQNLAESYQYANISVYYVDQIVNYEWDSALSKAVVKSRIVKNVTLLETKRVSTNPSDPFYFADVEFDFIKIIPSANARAELSIVWSNIDGDPTSSQQYSGFPTIVLKYYVGNSLTYNFASCLYGGTDFGYSDDVLEKLKAGFKGYVAGTQTTDPWTQQDVTNWKADVYGNSSKTGIIPIIYGNITSMYGDFTDPYIYDFDFITSGGFVYREYNENGAQTYPESSNNMEFYTGVTPIHQAMLSLVEQRQDCIALFDVTPKYDPNYITEYSRMLNTSYGTMHFPWCYVADPDIANHNILMSPSYVFLYTFLSNLDNNVDAQKWFPPAGVKRATARVVKKPYFEMGSVLLNKWQNDTTARVNPIMRLKQYGYVIYGQYTTLEAIDMYTHSALESLNVRLISNVVKKKIFDVCLNLAFEPNTENLWNKFFAQMDEFLRYMKYNEGVYDYRIVMDESTVTTDDINHLRCPGKVYIAPTRTAEFFDIDFIITEAGAQFNN